jgi:hypothetical protein
VRYQLLTYPGKLRVGDAAGGVGRLKAVGQHERGPAFRRAITLLPGDEISVGIEGIGTSVNRCVEVAV